LIFNDDTLDPNIEAERLSASFAAGLPKIELVKDDVVLGGGAVAGCLFPLLLFTEFLFFLLLAI
jgi:hypothetical protein